MSESILVAKSRSFALRIVRLYRFLRGKKESVLSRQILRSGTSVGANIAEGKFAQSRNDFVHKYGIALKEASETMYWLDLLHDAGYLPDGASAMSIRADCEELVRLLAASIKTARERGMTR